MDGNQGIKLYDLSNVNFILYVYRHSLIKFNLDRKNTLSKMILPRKQHYNIATVFLRDLGGS